MKIELENVLPAEIEKRSFEIITEELGDRVFDPLQEPIIKRAIHTSADFWKVVFYCDKFAEYSYAGFCIRYDGSRYDLPDYYRVF